MSDPKDRGGTTITLPSGLVAVMEECRGADEDVIANRKHQLKGDAYDIVMLRRLVSLGEKTKVTQNDLDALVSGDWMKLLLAIRTSLYGPTVALRLKCGCGEATDYEIDIDEIPETAYPNAEEFEIELPSGIKAVIRHPYHRDNRKLIGRKDISLSEMMMVRITSVDGQPAGIKTLQEMTGPDRTALRRAMAEHTYGPDTEVKFTCRECGAELVTRLELEPEFFFPRVT